jgi:thioredoxin 1
MAKTVLKIGTTHCGPCRMLKPIYHKLEEEYKDKIIFLEVSNEENVDLFEKYCIQFGIRGVPVVIIMDSEENELERVTGLGSEEKYRQIIEKHI